jgi:hypothetical protein
MFCIYELVKVKEREIENIIINGPGPGLLYQPSQLQKRTTRPQEFNKKMPSDTDWPENTEQSFDQYETLYEFFTANHDNHNHISIKQHGDLEERQKVCVILFRAKGKKFTSAASQNGFLFPAVEAAEEAEAKSNLLQLRSIGLRSSSILLLCLFRLSLSLSLSLIETPPGVVHLAIRKRRDWDKFGMTAI